MQQINPETFQSFKERKEDLLFVHLPTQLNAPLISLCLCFKSVHNDNNFLQLYVSSMCGSGHVYRRTCKESPLLHFLKSTVIVASLNGKLPGNH